MVIRKLWLNTAGYHKFFTFEQDDVVWWVCSVQLTLDLGTVLPPCDAFTMVNNIVN